MKEKVNGYLSFLFFGNNSWRCSCSICGGKCCITIDVHGLKAADAVRAIRNTVRAVPYDMTLQIIHGYNGGTAIRDSLRDHFLGDNVTGIETPWYNPGITYINVAGRIAA